jgi:hypothetical protein
MRESVIFFISVSFHFILYQVLSFTPSPANTSSRRGDRKERVQDLLWIDRFCLRANGDQNCTTAA